jgi:hypothetical protein
MKVTYGSAWSGFAPGAWQGFQTAGYRELTFVVGNVSSGDDLWFSAADAANNLGNQLELKYYTPEGSFPEGEWVRVRVPISELGLGSNPTLSYVAIQSGKPNAVVVYDWMQFEANTTLISGPSTPSARQSHVWNWGSDVDIFTSGGTVQVDVTDEWGGVQFHDVVGGGTMPSSAYGLVTILFGKEDPSQEVSVFLVDQNNDIVGSPVSIDDYYTSGSSEGLYNLIIPLEDFGAGVVNIGGIVLSADKEGTFFIEQVKFIEGLGFPLSGKTPLTADISSVMDHSMTDIFCPDGVVTAYNEEQGSSLYGASSWSFSQGCGTLRGFKQQNGQTFSLNGHYSSDYLFYDGHPGIDYPASIGTPVYATASGRISASDCPANNGYYCLTGSGHYGVLKIDHSTQNQGLTTSYNHLQSVASGLVVGSYVVKGQIIGYAGDIGAPGAPHLHVSVLWWVDMLAGNPVYLDPYGWQGSESDPYIKAKNVCLWDGGCISSSW